MAAETGRQPVPRDEPHWYKIIVSEGCALCWSGGDDVRVRMPGKRPKDPAERYEYDSAQWACGGHFM